MCIPVLPFFSCHIKFWNNTKSSLIDLQTLFSDVFEDIFNPMLRSPDRICCCYTGNTQIVFHVFGSFNLYWLLSIRCVPQILLMGSNSINQLTFVLHVANDSFMRLSQFITGESFTWFMLFHYICLLLYNCLTQYT